MNTDGTDFITLREEGLGGFETIETGLTKRELFAAMALQGLLANPNQGSGLAAEAVEAADALIDALNKGSN